MLHKIFWLIIAGALLVCQPPAQASTFVRVCKKGVIYYYFPDKGRATARQPEKINAGQHRLARPRAASRPSPKAVPRPAVSAPALPEAKVAAASLQVTPGVMRLIPGTYDQLQVPNHAKDKVIGAIGYLVSLLTKSGYYYPQILPVTNPRHWAGNTDALISPRAGAAGPEAGDNALAYSLAYFEEQMAAWGPKQQRPDFLMRVGSLPYCFPVAAPFSFKDSWWDSRSRGRFHHAVDIFAAEGTEVYAMTTGVVRALADRPEAGLILLLEGQDGRGYGYMHLQGYAPGIAEGKTVRSGDLIAYVGRTGIKESPAHLHLQVYADHRLCHDGLLNPYSLLVQLCRGQGVTDLDRRQLAAAPEPAPTINRIQVYRRPVLPTARKIPDHATSKRSSVLVIKNFIE